MSENRLKQLQDHFHANQTMNELIEHPSDSLNYYRGKSTIDKQLFKELFYGPNWTFRERCFDLVKKHKGIFRHHHLEKQTIKELDRDGQRYYSFLAMKNFFQKLNISFEDFQADPNIVTMTSAGMYSYDPAVCVKFGVHFHLYTKTILNLGTAKQAHFLERAKKMEDIGSFALTELGHGSNVRNLYTTAVYDKIKKCFVLNTPNDLAMKFWIGATANIANMTVVFAQLFIDQQQYGVHAFLVEIRDKTDHRLRKGIIVGDCGPKNGHNGVDNGFMIFKNVEVPLINLLDKFSQVDEDGQFKSSIEDADKRFAIQIGSLSGGRIMLSMYGCIGALNGLTIGLRYAAVRKQFGSPGEKEQSILEYPLTQMRLIPHLAQSLVYMVGSVNLTILWDQTQAMIFEPHSAQLSEVHAISSVLKGQTALFANQVIMECRQILGGHGYHLYNRLGTMLMDVDINVTWEGDAYVLMQQTAKFLLENIQKISQGKEIKHGTLYFLTAKPVTGVESAWKSNVAKEQLLDIEELCKALEVRCNALIQVSALKFTKNLQSQGDMFQAWNATLPFYLQRACKAYADVYCMREWRRIKVDSQNDEAVLNNIFRLWALMIIDQDEGLFKDLEYISRKNGGLIKECILDLVGKLKDEAIGIIDALAPPDEVLGSPMGASDGDVYNRYLSLIYQSKNCIQRVPWWQEIHKQE